MSFVKNTFWIVGATVLHLCLAHAAAVSDLEDAKSPNGRYEIALDQFNDGHLAYCLFRRAPKRVLLAFNNSYQPEKGELPGWSLRQASDARVFWNNASDLIAIEEAVHHGAGTVIVAQLTSAGAAKEIQLPEAALFKATHVSWNKQRLFCPRGWIGRRQLALELPGETHGYKTPVFDAIIRVRADGRVEVEEIRQADRTTNKSTVG